jgi:hypothetical protein
MRIDSSHAARLSSEIWESALFPLQDHTPNPAPLKTVLRARIRSTRTQEADSHLPVALNVFQPENHPCAKFRKYGGTCRNPRFLPVQAMRIPRCKFNVPHSTAVA